MTKRKFRIWIQPPKIPPDLGGFFLFLVAVGVYIVSTPRTLAGGDSAEITLGVYTQGIIHAPGYPLYLLLARAFTWIPLHPNFAARVNLFSTLWGIVTLILLALAIHTLYPANRLTTAGTVLLFGFSPYVWQHNTVAEVYSLHTAFMALALLLFFRWERHQHPQYILWMGIVFGLSLAHHLSAVLVALVIFSVVLWHSPRHDWWRVILPLSVIPIVLYLYLPIRAAANPAFNLLDYFDRDLTHPLDLLWMVRGGMFSNRMLGYSFIEWGFELVRFIMEISRTYLVGGVILGLWGWLALWQRNRKITLTLAAIFTGQVLFYTSYNVFDKWAMFHTSYLVWAVVLSVGIDTLPTKWFRWGQVLLILLIGLQIGFSWQHVQPNQQNATARLTESMMQLLPQDALLIGDWLHLRPIEAYQILYGERQDLRLYDYTLVSLGTRDTDQIHDDTILAESVRQKIFNQIDCTAPPIYIVNPAVLQGRYAITTITDRVHIVQPQPHCPN